MEHISLSDRQILRARAQKQLEYATSPRNDEILKQWEALAQGRRDTPTVRLLYSNFVDEVVLPRLQCQGETARRLEHTLLCTLVGRELFDDDTPIAPTFDISWNTQVKLFGISPERTHAATNGAKGFHIDPVIEDMEADLEKFKGGDFTVDRQGTLEWRALAEDVFGDILPTRMVTPSLVGSITNPLVMLTGMETLYLALYDCPEAFHTVMELAARVHEAYYDYLEKEQLLFPTHGISPVCQESFAFNHELPTENVTKTTQCWGFLECQEFTAASPEQYGEFIYPYLDRMAQRYGLLSYGCCERVDNLWVDYLSKWKHLRKLSVSPFNDENQIGEYLRGSNIVYYSKPRAEYVTNPGPLDEEALRRYFKGVCQASSGCILEMAQREVGTIFGDFERGKRYVQIARECIADYWKP